MKYSDVSTLKQYISQSFLQVIIVACTIVCATAAWSSPKGSYDIVYLLSPDLDRVLDYKDEIESVFDEEVNKKLKVVGRDKEFALIYNGNDSARSVAQTLIVHAELLDQAGYDEPYAAKDSSFHSLYNVSYGMGPNLEPLKKRYSRVYAYLGEEVKDSLFIEQTAYGNYTLIYRLRGDTRSTNSVAKKHGRKLRGKRISTTITPENNNTVVYGESSLIDDADKSSDDVASVPKEKPPLETILPSAAKKATKKATATTKTTKKSNSLSTSKRYAKVEQSIEEHIKKLRARGKISKDESTGWMVYDLEKDKSIVGINADQEFQAASMIKPFIALAFFQKVKDGKFVYGSKSRRKLEAMIQRSNNAATNWTIRQVGGPASCNSVLRSKYGHIFKKTDIKEYIPAGGRTYLNSASPADYIRFLRALWNNELPYGKEIRRLMALPGRDRLYYGTPIPRGTLVYNKTGTTAHLCGDMGILVPKTKKGGRYPYAIVGIIERRSRPADYGSWMGSRSRVIRDISTLVYKEMKRQHKFM